MACIFAILKSVGWVLHQASIFLSKPPPSSSLFLFQPFFLILSLFLLATPLHATAYLSIFLILFPI